MDRRSVLVLGSANLDLVVRVARHPRAGETVFGDSLVTVPGGKGLNQAIACALAGGRVCFAGAVGNDAHGDRLLRLLADEGVDVSGVLRLDAPTGTAHITVDAGGENTIVVVPGANAEVTADVLPDAPGDLGWLLTQLEIPLPTVAAALGWARRAAVRTVLTPAPVQPLGDDVLASVDLLVANRLEATELSGCHDPAMAAERLSGRARDVVVTLGADGSVWATGGTVRHREPGRRVAAVDTTGAGDTFVGALVSRLAEGVAMPEAMRWAAAAASISVGRAGATASMPTRAEVAVVLGGA